MSTRHRAKATAAVRNRARVESRAASRRPWRTTRPGRATRACPDAGLLVLAGAGDRRKSGEPPTGTCRRGGILGAVVGALPEVTAPSIIPLGGVLGAFLAATAARLRRRPRQEVTAATADGAWIGTALGLLIYAAANLLGVDSGP